MLENLDWSSIFVAAVASFIVGAIYYGVLRKPWMRALGKTPEDVRASMRPAVVYPVAALCQLGLAFVLAVLFSHFGQPAFAIGNALAASVAIWGGFVMTTMIVNHRFQGQSWLLTIVDGGYWLVALLTQAAALSLMAG